jgi:tetratricopeptide (TPR) repeat protein
VKIPPAPALLLTVLGCVACASESADEARGSGSTPVDATAPLPPGAQAWSFLGDSLYPPELPEEVRTRRQEQLDEALLELEADPEGADALIWVGRRYAYLGKFREAIEAFTRGIAAHPEDARLYRHRGHRYITLRELDRAIADFNRAAELTEGADDEVEPDGQPNALGIPTSTLHFNIWYHFGLAHYLKGEYEEAADKYRRCMEVSVHPDSKIATAHWWYMSLRRAGRQEEARALIQGMDLEAMAPEVIESGSYLALLRLYAAGEGGEGAPDPGTLDGATQGYGIGNWKLYNGDRQGAQEVFRTIVAARDQWGAFGYIAAEADLARMGEG